MRKITSWLKITIFATLAFLALLIGFGIPLGIKISHRKTIEKLGYSREFADYVLEQDMFETIRDLGYNETLSAVLMAPDYQADNYDAYLQIKYHETGNFLPLTNTFLSKGYVPDDINFFFDRFNAENLSQLAARDHLGHAQEYFAKDYAKLKDLDRYLAYSEDIEEAVYSVANNLDLPEYEADESRHDFSFDMLVNKNYAVTEDFEPDNLVDAGNGFELNKEAYDAFLEMAATAKEEGLILEINSAYRSVAEQQSVMDAQCRQYGQTYCESHVAKPGFSEHHTGLAIDIKTPHNGTFAYSKEFTWLKEHSAEYGFIWRYQDAQKKYSRFAEEAWHYRYVGKELAQKVKDSGLSYDEYYVTQIER